jgi:replicative DNA helicase
MIYNMDLEKTVLKGLLQHSHKWAEISIFLNEKDFYSEDSKVHLSIFKLIKNALDNAETIDDTILIPRLEQLKVSFPDSIDLPEYIRSLVFHKITEEIFISSVKELKKFSARREIYNSCKDVANYVKKIDPNLKYSEIIDKADEMYNKNIKEFEFTDDGPVNLFEIMEQVIEERGNNPVEEAGLMGPHQRINDIYGSLLLEGNISVIVARSGVGKMSTLSTKVLTPDGFTEMRNIHKGSKVICPDGSTSTVINTFDHKQKDVYRVHFNDGRFTDCGLEHLWKIWGRDNKGVYNWQVVDTAEIISHLKHPTKKVYIPLVEEIGEDVDLPMDPYCVGAFIGDGCLSTGPVIESADIEVINRMKESLGSEVSIRKSQNSKSQSYRFLAKSACGRKNDCISKLREIGLYGKRSWEKHIPEAYQNASFNQKISLIQGMMDTDGTISKSKGRSGNSTSYGSLSYSTCSEQLAKDFQKLIWSIGGIAKIKTKNTFYNKNGNRVDCRTSFRVSIRFRNPKQLFHIKRKKDKAPDFEKYQYSDLKLGINKVEKLPNKEDCRCIEVDHPDHLYIVDEYIVTHNTQFCMDYTTRVSAKYDIPVLHFDNGEMSEEELIFRQCSAMTGIPIYLLQSGKWRTSSYKNLSSEQVVAKVRSAWNKIKNLKFYYENVAGMSADEMCAYLKRFYYSKIGRGKPMIFSFDYIKTDFNTLGKVDGWQQVSSMVHKFKQTIHRDLCFDGKPCVSMMTSVQANRLGITGNRGTESIVDDESVVSLSDGITQFCSHLFLLRRKIPDEIHEEGPNFGTHKLINLKARHLGKDALRAINPVLMPDGSNKKNFINLEIENFRVSEKGDLQDIVDAANHTDINVETNDVNDNIPISLSQ